jgi:radical SAM superfamily enzyme YgiQ (UPF0313 family)
LGKNYWNNWEVDSENLEYWFNSNSDLKNKIISYISDCEYNPDIIGFCVNYFSHDVAKFCMNELKKIYPNAKMVAGGSSFFNITEKQAAKEPYDIVVCGEGESAFIDILTSNTTNKVIRKNKLKSLNELPIPDFSLFPLHLYSQNETIPIESSRGCNNICGFCDNNVRWGNIRKKPIYHLREELNFIKNKHGNIHLYFCDSLLNPSREDFVNLLQLLNEFDFTWNGMIQVDNIDSQIANMMHLCGCKNVFIGVESFSQKFLKNIKKDRYTIDASNVIQTLYEADIKVDIGIIVAGQPFQERKEFEYDIEKIKILSKYLEGVSINPLSIIKNTILQKNYNELEIHFSKNYEQ